MRPYEAADAWGVAAEELIGDAQRNAAYLSATMERRVAARLGGRVVAGAEPYDVELPDGRKLEVRGFTRQISFAPSRSRGSQRTLRPGEVREKLAQVDGYVIYDAQKFPASPCWLVPSGLVTSWMDGGQMGEAGRLSRTKLLSMLALAVGDRPTRTSSQQEAEGEEDLGDEHWSIEVFACDRDALRSEPDRPLLVGRTLERVDRALADIRVGLMHVRAAIGTTPDDPSDIVKEGGALLLRALLTPENLSAASGFNLPDPLTSMTVRRAGEQRPFFAVFLDVDLVQLVSAYAATSADSVEAAALERAFAEAVADGIISVASAGAHTLGWAATA